MKITQFVFSASILISIFNTTTCMEENSPSILFDKDRFSIVSKYLPLDATSKILRTCSTFYNMYAVGIPLYMTKKSTIVTKEQFQKVQFGIDRWLQENPEICYNFTNNEHTHVLCHYTQTNNLVMFKHVINHENDSHLAQRINILKFFQYIKNDDLNNNLMAYRGISNSTTSINHQDLISAAKQNHIPAIQALLKNGASINTTDSERRSALLWACLEGHRESVKLLLKNNAFVNDQEKFISVNHKDSQGKTALHWATEKNHFSIVKLLLKNNAFVDIKDDEFGATPLFYAVTNGNIDIIELLLNNNADIHIKGKWDKTALHWAAQSGMKDSVKILLHNGCDVHARTELYNTAKTFARENKHWEIVELLEKWENDNPKNSSNCIIS